MIDYLCLIIFRHFFRICARRAPEGFAAEDVEVTVFHSPRLRFRRPIGHAVFSLRRVRAQPGHLVPRGWFPVSPPGQPGEARGFVELTLGAFALGDEAPRSLGLGGGEGGEGGGRPMRDRVIALPAAPGRSLYQLRLRVHRAEGLPRSQTVFGEAHAHLVRVDFLGTSQATEVRRGHADPAWNEEARVPLHMPCWDDSVCVRLLSEARATSREQLLGEVCLHLDDVAAGEMPPTWFNFYRPDPEACGVAGLFGAPEAAPSLPSGRLLLSAALERTEGALLAVGPAAAARDPPGAEGALWADLYEVVFDEPQQPCEVSVRISHGAMPGELEAEPPERRTRAFVWTGDGGRLSAENLALPGGGMAADVIVSVYVRYDDWLGCGTLQRHLFVRLPAAGLPWSDASPRWHELHRVGGGAEHEAAGFLLMSLALGPLYR